MKLPLPNPQYFIQHQYWIRGGAWGLLICLLLYVVFIVLFVVSGGMLSQVMLWPAFITGHGIVLLWNFVHPYGMFCAKTLHYGAWSLEPVQGGVRCSDFGTSNSGYCYDPFMYPDDKCADISGTVSFFIVLILHFIIYFGLGVGFAILRKKFKGKYVFTLRKDEKS